MNDIYILTKLEQIRAIVEPLRIRILNLLIQESLTTKQVANHLGENVNKLYHHIEILEEAGMIALVETRKNRGTLEKYYRSVAKFFTLSPILFEVRLETENMVLNTELTFSSALQATMMELKESLAHRLVDMDKRFFDRFHIKTSKEKADELYEEFQVWLQKCKNADSESGETEFGITSTFYPVKNKKTGLIK